MATALEEFEPTIWYKSPQDQYADTPDVPEFLKFTQEELKGEHDSEDTRRHMYTKDMTDEHRERTLAALRKRIDETKGECE